MLCKDAAEDLLHDTAIFEHIGDARGHPQVIFEDAIGAVAIANQISAANMHINISWYLYPPELGPILGRAENQFAGNNAIRQNLLIAVNISHKQIQGLQALLQPPLQHFPLMGRNNAGNQIKRENLFRPFLTAVDRKGHTARAEGGISLVLAALHGRGRDAVETLDKVGVVGPRLLLGTKHLIIKRAGFVSIKQHESGFGSVLRYCSAAMPIKSCDFCYCFCDFCYCFIVERCKL